VPDAPDADRRPVPYRRADAEAGRVGLTDAPVQERWTGNWATEHPPPDGDRTAPRRTGSRWSGWLAAVLMLAAAGLLFWGPWRSGADDRQTTSNAATAAEPSAAAGNPAGGTGAAAGRATRIVDGPIVPTRIAIPAIGVNTVVEHRGTVRTKNAFTGQLVDAYGVPTSMRTTSWWSDGPEPGSGQMAVILGHTQVGGYGVFNKLGRLQPGSAVTLQAANGDTLRLQVLGRPVTGLDKSTSALADTLNGHPAGADVAFVTCGGTFDQQAGASEDNVVVFASVVPVG
jgi:hypothetical protein